MGVRLAMPKKIIASDFKVSIRFDKAEIFKNVSVKLQAGHHSNSSEIRYRLEEHLAAAELALLRKKLEGFNAREIFKVDQKFNYTLARLALARSFRNKETLSMPPSSAFLSALLPTEISEDVIANLNELYFEVWQPRHGARVARRIWICQGLSIVVKRWLSPIVSLIERVRKITLSG